METLRITLTGEPRTKKNSQRIFVRPNGQRFIRPSAQYEAYERTCLLQLRKLRQPELDGPVNVACVYYMPTLRRVDLCNLLEATCDILVHAGVLIDDNSRVVVSHDGSRVLLDRGRPRAEITITEAESEAEWNDC